MFLDHATIGRIDGKDFKKVVDILDAVDRLQFGQCRKSTADHSANDVWDVDVAEESGDAFSGVKLDSHSAIEKPK